MDDDIYEADLEDRFRDLEVEEEIRRMRGGKPPRRAGGKKASGGTEDELADLKAALDGDRPLERYVLALCTRCNAKNRIRLARLREADPICGACRRPLSFTRI